MVLARKHIKALADGEKIHASDIQGGLGGLGMGNVYYVVPTNASYYTQFVNDHKVTYADRSESIVPCNMAAADVDIQIALDRTVALRNDYVILMPSEGNYELTATLTMTKKSVHLIGAGNMASVGSKNTVRLDARGLAFHAVTTSSGGIEVAGLYINTASDYYGIVMTDDTLSGYGMNIHHNTVFVYSTTSGGGGIVGTAAASGGYSTIHHNIIRCGTTNGARVAYGIAIESTGTYAVIHDNIIQALNGNTLDYGIYVGAAYGGMVIDNIIHEAVAHGGVGAATVTIGIQLSDSALAVGNRIGITTTANSFGGGTGGKSFVLNYDSTTAGGTLLNG